MRKFLIKIGGYFTFVGNQYRLEVDGQEFFIDLLLYHRQLRCLVAVELKVGAFKPEYAGKMQFYLSALNDRVRLPGRKPFHRHYIVQGQKQDDCGICAPGYEKANRRFNLQTDGKTAPGP